MRRGDWSGTVVPMQVCAYSGCVVFPRFVGRIRKLNVCRTPTPIQNQWYEFFDHVGWCHNQSRWCGSPLSMTAGEQVPVFQDVMGDNRVIRAYPLLKADVGKTLRIFGLDSNGMVLRTKNLDGTWSDGVVITLAAPYGSTSVYVRRIDRVLKDKTQGEVFVYAYYAAEDKLENIATYEPGETNPSLTKYHLNASCCGSSTASGTCGDIKSIIALVKLRYVPVEFDNDVVLIENLDALKLMILSLRAEEAGNRRDKNGFESDAIRELNLQLRDDMPEDQTPVDLGEFGGTSVGYQQTF